MIRIIREEDDPKAVMMKRFELTEPQVEAILNMRLRQLRKLDEIEIRKEFDDLKTEKKDLTALLKSEDRQWKCVAYEIEEVKKTFGPKHAARQASHRLRRRAGDRRRRRCSRR